MSSSTVPQDQQVTPLWREVDAAFAPIGDAVDAASNVLEEFGELAGAIVGPANANKADNKRQQDRNDLTRLAANISKAKRM